jgi:Cu-Zn family superoxide dismutase
MTIKLIAAGLAGALLAGCTMADRPSERAAPLRSSYVDLHAPDGSSRGRVSIIQTEDGISMRVEGANLPPGTHGAHLHQVGRCDPPDFASAGPHWNPTGRQHGRDNPSGAHLGDVPNLVVGSNGRGALEHRIAGARVRSGAAPLIDADGASLVIHANADDYRTDPSGNSGGRIACAVLR